MKYLNSVRVLYLYIVGCVCCGGVGWCSSRAVGMPPYPHAVAAIPQMSYALHNNGKLNLN